LGVFSSLFGPSREEIWSSLRGQIAAELVDGGFWRGDRLRMQAGDWTVTLDEYTQMVPAGKVHVHIPHTRMRAPFPNPTGFRFSIHRASMFSALGTLLGMQDIEVGYPEFDKEFVIKSNDESTVRSLFDNAPLRALMAAQPKFQLCIQNDEGWFGTKYPPDVDVLIFDVAAKIRDVDRLRGIYDVFAGTLGKLSKMGVAGSGTGSVTI
jgi:hypothetical protein